MFDLSRASAQAVRDPAVQTTRFCVAVVVLCPINLNNSCLPTYLPATTATRLSHVVSVVTTTDNRHMFYYIFIIHIIICSKCCEDSLSIINLLSLCLNYLC